MSRPDALSALAGKSLAAEMEWVRAQMVPGFPTDTRSAIVCSVFAANALGISLFRSPAENIDEALRRALRTAAELGFHVRVLDP